MVSSVEVSHDINDPTVGAAVAAMRGDGEPGHVRRVRDGMVRVRWRADLQVEIGNAWLTAPVLPHNVKGVRSGVCPCEAQ
jgi:hypothetical protein